MIEKEIKHGRESSYSKKGCRCDECRGAMKKARAEYPISVHGTLWSYGKGCRCDLCKKVKSVDWKKRHPNARPRTTNLVTGTRICYVCKEEKPLEEFCSNKNRRISLGRSNECKRCHNLRSKRNKNTPKHRFESYVSGAKVRKIQFNLSFEEFESFWNKSCYYCGTDIDGIGLDRKDSGDGYNMNNIVPCCTQCNRAKTIQTTDQFIEMCKKVAEKFKHYIVPLK